MTTGKKWSSPNPTCFDLLTLENCIVRDLGLNARTTMVRHDREHLQVQVEVYREVEGARIGIAKFGEMVRQEQGDITPVIYRCLLQAYWRAHDLAHGDTEQRLRYGKSR